jgi:magnesium chelatase family protein
MSLATIRSFAFSGIEAVPVDVQVQIASGLPAFLMVGPVTQRASGWPQRGQARLCLPWPFAFRKENCNLCS